MGRKTKPTALKELAGNPGKRALPKNEPRPASGLPDRPTHLSKDGRIEWDRLAPQLDKIGLLTKIDLAAFTAYCECYALYIKAKRVVSTKGMTYKHNGLIRKRPEVQIASEQLRLMRQYLVEFGLTPSARAKVSSQMKDNTQLPLPGMDQESRDPNKPEIPTGPLTDDQFFGIEANNVRH